MANEITDPRGVSFRGRRCLALKAGAALLTIWAVGSGAALAQAGAAATEGPSGNQDIVVTAQKREQSINDVPMSITAATGERLQDLGIKDTGDLVKIAAGLSFAKSQVGTPLYTLRGIGFESSSIASRQAVTLYMDEATIPFGVESRGAQLDLERVEVLKGPQGTLFGNNSTGGAINFIANRPTREMKAGAVVTYGRFGQLDLMGYVSGPVSDTLMVRAAVEHQSGGEWQRSITRDAENGITKFINSRLSVLWEPSDRFRALVTLSHWVDQSDYIFPQAVQILDPTNPYFLQTPFANYPARPRGNRDADWNVDAPRRRNNNYTNLTARLDYDLSDQLTLTSLTTYVRYKQFIPAEADGLPGPSIDQTLKGNSKTFAQELRVAANLDRLNLIVGANYQRDNTFEDAPLYISDSSIALLFADLVGVPYNTTGIRQRQIFENYAAFANAEFEVSDQLTLQGGIRYTQANIDFSGCSRDTGDGFAAGVWNNFFNALFPRPSGPVSIQPGECFTLNTTTRTPENVETEFDQNNISWRGGVQYKASRDLLLYANVSKGYKGGVFPFNSSTFDTGQDPASQESVLAYEAGFKAGLLDGAVQFNAAAFYMNYKDKQVVGAIDEGTGTGTVNKLVNVPKSRVYGGEIELSVRPVEGLSLNFNGSHIRSEVKEYVGTNNLGAVQDFRGADLPFVPRWQLNGGFRYEFNTGGNLIPFVTANALYNSRANAGLGELAPFTIKPYTLVDATLGVESADKKWKAFVWGRNIFNETYWTGTFRALDTLERYMGTPASYGVTFAVNY